MSAGARASARGRGESGGHRPGPLGGAADFNARIVGASCDLVGGAQAHGAFLKDLEQQTPKKVDLGAAPDPRTAAAHRL